MRTKAKQQITVMQVHKEIKMEKQSKLKELYTKYKEMILYLIFGVLTTALNYAVFFIFNIPLGVHYEISNCIAWVAGVIFAFFTNRSIVFNSQAKGFKKKFIEAAEFVAARLFSLVAEMIILWFFVEILPLYPDENWNTLIVKFIGAVVVVILNYIASKFVIFKKDKDESKRETLDN